MELIHLKSGYFFPRRKILIEKVLSFQIEKLMAIWELILGTVGMVILSSGE